MAPRGTRAAAGDAGRRLLARRITCRARARHCSLPSKPRAAGYVEGQNVIIEYRWADDQLDRLPALAAELVRRRVSVIATPAGSVATVAAQAATTTIPIVFGSENDPIKAGLVTSFNRPSGNATGVYFLSGGLGEKRLGLIRELLPRADLVGLLLNPNNPLADATTAEVRAAAVGRSSFNCRMK